MEEKEKAKRKELRQTLMEKRATIGALDSKEQKILDDADLDDDAYYIKDENDHLVDIKFVHGDSVADSDDAAEGKFERMLTEKTDYEIEDEREDSLVDKDDDDKPNQEVFKINSSLNESNDDRGDEYQPKLESMKTVVPKAVSADDAVNTSDSPSVKSDLSSLSDKIEKTKIDSSHDLSSLIKDDHYEEQNIDRLTRKDNIIKKSKTRIRAGRAKRKIVWSMLKMKKFLKKGVESEESWEEMSWIKKVIYICIDAPLDFIRRLTIPPADSEMWNRRIAAVVPFFSVFWVFITTGMINFYDAPPIAFYVAEGVALIVSIIICFVTPLNHGPRRGMIVFAVFAFLLSILWIWFFANIIIDLLGVLGLIMGFKPIFLVLTLLAWGNSVGDLMANSAVAKKGFARMAMTGCFAGPLFNLLIGLGAILILSAINGINTEGEKLTNDITLLIAISCELVQLIIIIILSVSSKFYLRKFQGFIQLGFFVLIMTAVTIGAFVIEA